ncbi:hypothetical protein [Flavobacterium sp.]|jgi:hypothetical protein|uniref:hypothetical protein n=1 Tax=Flavobacterium sp. TaxID=239 RepID=UPI0037BEDBC0
MKKLVFTALAVVAFSAVSIAENLAKESVVKVANKKVLLSVDCDYRKFVAYCDFIAGGHSVAYATSSSYSIYFQCMAEEAPISQ